MDDARDAIVPETKRTCVMVVEDEKSVRNFAIAALKEIGYRVLAAPDAAGETHTMKLEKPLPVFVLSWSVFKDKDGKRQFRRDAYDRDAATVAALARAGLKSQKSEVVQAVNQQR